ncbi:MAG TPA: hypothetical protein VH877_17490 [Polyangia bacterium]|jgi:hypothetical protein|nr:hypothetical protein [Polyangia bacterium]
MAIQHDDKNPTQGSNVNNPQGTTVTPTPPRVAAQGNMGAQGDIGSPISNEAYDILAALHAKLEGLEAYRKFAQDGNQQIWKQLCDLDVQGVGVLLDQLETLVKDGKLRSQIAQRPKVKG